MTHLTNSNTGKHFQRPCTPKQAFSLIFILINYVSAHVDVGRSYCTLLLVRLYCIYITVFFFQLWATPPFLLCTALRENSAHQQNIQKLSGFFFCYFATFLVQSPQLETWLKLVWSMDWGSCSNKNGCTLFCCRNVLLRCWYTWYLVYMPHKPLQASLFF